MRPARIAYIRINHAPCSQQIDSIAANQREIAPRRQLFGKQINLRDMERWVRSKIRPADSNRGAPLASGGAGYRSRNSVPASNSEAVVCDAQKQRRSRGIDDLWIRTDPSSGLWSGRRRNDG